MRFCFLYLFILCVRPFWGQSIGGSITDDKGNPIAFASIYIPELKSGTTSNYDGLYTLALGRGTYHVLFQCMGYETMEQTITIEEADLQINVQLSSRKYTLPELKVLSSGEDPAYYIMRHAIAMAPYYRDQVSAYKCRVYLKGTGMFTKIPRILKKQLEKEGMEKDKAFVMETMSDVEFKLPKEVRQKVIAMRSSGQDNNTSPMYMITSSLYNARDYEMIGPVDKNALSVYEFHLEGDFQDQGRTIHKIKVMPKRKGQDLFEGHIFIADQFWNIHSAALKVKIPMGNVQMNQIYGAVDENTWMPVSLDFNIEFKGLGMEMNYKYVASISNYTITLNPLLDHSFLVRAQQVVQNEQLERAQLVDVNMGDVEVIETSKKETALEVLLKKDELSNREAIKLQRLMQKEIKKEAAPEPLEIINSVIVSDKNINNDSAFWASIRPVPLLKNELYSFKGKDSIMKVALTPEYRDSVRNERRKFKMKYLATGKTYNYSNDSVKTYRNVHVPGVVNLMGIDYNTVDGLRLNYPFSYYYSDTTGKQLKVNTALAYAFSREVLDADFNVSYRWNGITHSTLMLAGGKQTLDFNRQNGMPSLLNAGYTLFYKENYKKLYASNFGTVAYKSELLNGLNFKFSGSYALRMPLENTTDFTIFSYNKEFTPNTPNNASLGSWQLDESRAISATVAVDYTYRHRYRIVNNVKRHVDAQYPTVFGLYKGAYGATNSQFARYDFAELGVRQKLQIGLANELNYELKGGGFLNNNKIYFADFKYFNTGQPMLMISAQHNMFRLLPYYEAAVDTWFAEGHVNYLSDRLLMKRLPFLGNTLLAENVMLNYLYTPDFKNYVEMGYGVRNIFLMLNVELNTSFKEGKHYMSGVKIGVNIN